MRLEDLGVIGNCQFSALADRTGSIVWCCLPRFDAEPVFSTLLDEGSGGFFAVQPADNTSGTMRYLDNTNVLETVFRTTDGAFRLIDFAPRFLQYNRVFRPTQIVRILEPIDGTPRVKILCRPTLGWSKRIPRELHGSNHVEYESFSEPLRLTTDIPKSWLKGTPFALTNRRHMVLSWGPPMEAALDLTCDQFFQETVRYWRRWVKHCNIPTLFQEAVIRSALALKLHCFEDTGAIIAAMTTSIPESMGSGRTWDYRYCWLRDAYYTLTAFRRLGHFEESESFVSFLYNIAASATDLALSPLYKIDGTKTPVEEILPEWQGFENEGPVRVGNAAALHAQHDIFGEMVLALSPMFVDERFREERSRSAFQLIERLARKAISVAGTPDAGIWEYRTEWSPQTFSSLMCWAAADRMSRVALRHLGESHALEFRQAADKIRDEIVKNAWNADLGSFVASYGGRSLDASLLQMAALRFLPSSDARLQSTVEAIRKTLAQGGWLLRYNLDDGFGMPSVAFMLCTFWLVEALTAIGQHEEARKVMDHTQTMTSPLGLLSEDYSMTTEHERLLGNYPQAYSHVGLINAAFACSPRWSEFL